MPQKNSQHEPQPNSHINHNYKTLARENLPFHPYFVPYPSVIHPTFPVSEKKLIFACTSTYTFTRAYLIEILS